jgi:hypothetical protein
MAAVAQELVKMAFQPLEQVEAECPEMEEMVSEAIFYLEVVAVAERHQRQVIQEEMV